MGIKSRFPINSLASIQECLNAQADGVEIDVQLSQDSVLFAFHDFNLDESTTQQGIIHQLSSQEISTATYRNLLGGKHPVATLDSIFSWVNQFPEAYITLDIKLYTEQPYTPFQQAFALTLADFLGAHPRTKPVMIESQDTSFLNYFHLLHPTSPTYYYTNDFELGHSIVKQFGYRGLTMDFENVASEQIDSLHAQGYEISVWNVKNGNQNTAAIQLKPDFIQTDEIKDLLNKVQPKK